SIDKENCRKDPRGQMRFYKLSSCNPPISKGSPKIAPYTSAWRIDHEYWLPSETINAVPRWRQSDQDLRRKQSLFSEQPQVLSRIAIRDFSSFPCAIGRAWRFGDRSVRLMVGHHLALDPAIGLLQTLSQGPGRLPIELCF